MVVLPKIGREAVSPRARSYIILLCTLNPFRHLFYKTVSFPHEESSLTGRLVFRKDIIAVLREIIFRVVVAGSRNISCGFIESF